MSSNLFQIKLRQITASIWFGKMYKILSDLPIALKAKNYGLSDNTTTRTTCVRYWWLKSLDKAHSESERLMWKFRKLLVLYVNRQIRMLRWRFRYINLKKNNSRFQTIRLERCDWNSGTMQLKTFSAQSRRKYLTILWLGKFTWYVLRLKVRVRTSAWLGLVYGFVFFRANRTC